MKLNYLFSILYVIGIIYFFITQDPNIILGCGVFGIISSKKIPFDYTTFSVLGINNDSRGGDSCGVFIDGEVEYGVDKQKLFENFMYDSVLVQTTDDCHIALGHCRKASVGKVGLETAQPVCIYNSDNEIEYVLMHNGTIHNYEELAKKYIPEIDIEGMTDSQVMARIFYHKGYDALAEYNGGAVFIIVDYRKGGPTVLMWKGASPKYYSSKEMDEERPLFISRSDDELVFSSISKYLPALRPYNELRTLPVNCLICYTGTKLVKVGEYDRSKCQQNKKYTQTYYSKASEDNELFPQYTYSQFVTVDYLNYVYKANGVPINGKHWLSKYGTLYREKPQHAQQVVEMCFFEGVPIPNEDAYNLIVKNCKKSKFDRSDFLALYENVIRYLSYDQLYLDERNHCVKATSPTTYCDYNGDHQFIGQTQIREFDHGMMINTRPCLGVYPDINVRLKVDLKAIKKIWKV